MAIPGSEGAETRATGKWTTAGVPHAGWRCIGVEERPGQDHLCEMCEARRVRFVHVMTHDAYHGELRVGCVCAGHMEGNPAAAHHRETRFKLGLSRRDRWLARDWRVSAAGNEFVNTSDGFNVVVFSRGSIWAARIEHRASGYARMSKLPYRTREAAKLAAFDAMLAIKARQPWRKPR